MGFRLSRIRAEWFALLVSGFSLPVYGAQCAAQSLPHTTALVELYTSHRCSSCRPADRWLSRLASSGGFPEKLVPIALHVDYADYIGQRDAYASREFSPPRHRKLTPLQRLALAYTPRVMLQGRDFRAWDTPAFDVAVAGVNSAPPRARIGLELVSASSAALVVRASAELLELAQVGAAGLYLAAYEHRVDRYVVLQWEGPEPFIRTRLGLERALPLLPGALAANSGVVALVQNRRTEEVLQALLLATCR